MQWDLGLGGLGLLAAMSLAFGVIVQLLFLLFSRGTSRWTWLIGAVAYFVGGLFVSEVWFGWATGAELQPNIDGLSFDETLLLSPLFGLGAVAATWVLNRTSLRSGHA